MILRSKRVAALPSRNRAGYAAGKVSSAEMAFGRVSSLHHATRGVGAEVTMAWCNGVMCLAEACMHSHYAVDGPNINLKLTSSRDGITRRGYTWGRLPSTKTVLPRERWRIWAT